MSLSVDAFFVDAAGQEHSLELESNLAGFESARRDFYSASPKELGLEILPQLDGSAMLEVRGSELESLLIEVEKLLGTLSDDDFVSFWSFRLNNIRKAVFRAQAYGDAGGVCIG